MPRGDLLAPLGHYFRVADDTPRIVNDSILRNAQLIEVDSADFRDTGEHGATE